MASLKLRILTLNCWGLQLLSKRKNERIADICQELSKGNYDIVMLQEIWCQSDYLKLCEKIMPVMQYTHYWHSGMLGSGVCIFSKYDILETFQHNYSVNGYAQRLFHGDWYAGKCVGLAKIATQDFRINVYVSHNHAQYTEPDEYAANRIAQAYEFGQFVRFTSEACDICIVGGDFNFMPSDLGYQLIKCNANLEDAWLTQKENKGHQITINAESNVFTKPGLTEKCIDFIMYKSNSGNVIDCERCSTVMSKVPEKDYNYSDHEGVAADLTLRRLVTAMATPREAGEVEKHFSNAIPILDTAMKHVKASQLSQAMAFVLCVVLLLFTNDLQIPYGLDCILKCLRLVFVLVAAFTFWSAAIMASKELNSLLAVRKDINNLLKANPPSVNASSGR